MKASKFVISVKSILLFLILAILIALELKGGRSYFDELLCIFAVGYVLFLILHRKFSRSDLITVSLLGITIVIGIVSNVFSGLNTPLLSIVVDIIAETKIIWIFLATKYCVGERVKNDFVCIVTPLAKFFCLSAFVCGIVSQFIDIGMTGEVRYGINTFRFVFPMSFQFLAVGIVMFATLTSNKKLQHANLYYVVGCISLMLAAKSSPLLFGVVFLFLLQYFRKGKELDKKTIAIIAVIILVLGTYQIQTYLLNKDAPRYLFFYYGGVTANNYFPLGSGFATFGSDQAARLYSPLYQQYGFSNLFGMSRKDGSFLSDTFWAMAIGQFGWIGFCIYISVYVRIFLSLKRQVQLRVEEKAFVYSSYIQYLVHAVGSAILSSSAGVIGFIALGMVIEPEQRIELINGCNDDC